jgi:GGDEF domain-containing protein
MSFTIGSRDDLIADLGVAVAPGEPEKLFVVFRIEGFDQFTRQYGDGGPDALIGHVLRCLPPASGPFGFYYRPRKDELCVLISGCLDGVEGGLFEAANAVYEILGSSGISLDFGTAFLPEEASDPTAALALADGRMTGGPLARDPESLATSALVANAD